MSFSSTNPEIQIIKRLDLSKIPAGSVEKFYFHITENGLGLPVYIPIIVAKGKMEGPTLGFSAAVHGNELNGIKVIHKLMAEIVEEVETLKGIIIAIPVVNTIGALNTERVFNNGEDLNRIMPGKPKGNSSAQFAHRFVKSVISQLDYLVDLHTASFGRVNSLYVRVDLENPQAAQFARLQHPQIIVHNKGRDGSLRGAAAKLGIPAITVEVGDPQRFQNKLIRESLVGIHNILSYLKMLPLEEKHSEAPAIVCEKSYWLYTDRGGILEVFPHVTDRVKKGQTVAKLSDIFGHTIKQYKSPADGVVVGKSVNPISQTGARIIHLGVENS